MHFLRLSILLFLLSASPAAVAWSKDVHALVCAAAYQITSQAGRNLVDRVSQGTWPEGCTWPDEVRYSTHKSTYQYHFVNVPKSSGRMDVVMSKDCAAHDCVHQAVKRYAIYLIAPSTREQDRLDALRFVGHFVADLHQPLHAGYAEDLGGNRIVLRMPDGRDRNLHSIWDGYLPEQAGFTGIEDMQRLVDGLSDQDKLDWRTVSFNAAVQQAHDLARQYAYRTADGQAIRSGFRLRQSYVQRAVPIVETQLSKSVIRLAHLLHLIGSNQLQPDDLNG